MVQLFAFLCNVNCMVGCDLVCRVWILVRSHSNVRHVSQTLLTSDCTWTSHHHSAYAFLHIFSIHSDHIHSVAHILTHLSRLSVEEDISGTLECYDRRMITFSCCSQPVLPTIVDMSHTDPKIEDASSANTQSYR